MWKAQLSMEAARLLEVLEMNALPLCGCVIKKGNVCHTAFMRLLKIQYITKRSLAGCEIRGFHKKGLTTHGDVFLACAQQNKEGSTAHTCTVTTVF